MKKLFLGLLLFLTIGWMGSCNSDQQVDKDEIDYLKLGQSISSNVFTVLSGALKTALEDGGITNAVQYCNLAAEPLVDSLSKVYHADIRRTALRVRNPANQPSPREQIQLNKFNDAVVNGIAAQGVLDTIDKKTIAYFAPILMMPLCEKCHGVPSQSLTEIDHQFIQRLYPADKAINFKTGDLRGMWSIQFSK